MLGRPYCIIVWLSLLTILIINVTNIHSALPQIRWCVVGERQESSCWKMSADLQQANMMIVTCVKAWHIFHCMELIKENQADAVNLDAEEIYIGGKYFNMKPIIGERVEKSEFLEDAVVVVKKLHYFAEGLQDLQLKRVCLAGADETNIQYQAIINVLFPLGFMKVYNEECKSAIPSLSNYFGESCAPGAWTLDPTMKSKYGDKLCKLCHKGCTEQDYFAGPDGALRCLVNNEADVAVTTSKALARKNLSPDSYQFLCIQGARKHLNKTCEWMGRRANAICISSKSAGPTQDKWKKTLLFVYTKFLDKKPDWLYDVIFSRPDITGVDDVYHQDTYERYLGLVFVRSMTTPYPKLDCGVSLPVRWCVYLKKHIKKCNQTAMAFESERLKPQISCVTARSLDECRRWVTNGAADITVLRPDEAFKAYRQDDLVPVASEKYQDSDATLYGLAVVKKGSAMTVDNLLGAKSCHPGANDILGWQMPLTMLERLGLLQILDCDYARSAGGFFWESCVPEVNRYTKHPGDNPQSLCTLCGGLDKCGESSPFRDYRGAIKCLVQPQGGDVAFVTNETLLQHNVDLANKNFELLCLNGSRSSVIDYESCYWLKIPSKVIVVSKKYTSNDDRRKITQLLIDGQKFFGGRKPNTFSMFANDDDPTTLFSDPTTELIPVWPEDPIEKVLGDDYVAVYGKTLECSKSAFHLVDSKLFGGAIFLTLIMLIWGIT